MRERKSIELSREEIEQAFRRREQQGKNFGDWLQWGAPNFLKRYLRYEIGVSIKIKSRLLELNGEGYCALLLSP